MKSIQKMIAIAGLCALSAGSAMADGAEAGPGRDRALMASSTRDAMEVRAEAMKVPMNKPTTMPGFMPALKSGLTRAEVRADAMKAMRNRPTSMPGFMPVLKSGLTRAEVRAEAMEAMRAR